LASSSLPNLAPDRAKFGKEELAKVLSGQYVEETAGAEPVTAAKLSVKEIRAEAGKVGLKLNKAELEALLDDDEEQIAFIHEKIKVRREAQAAPA